MNNDKNTNNNGSAVANEGQRSSNEFWGNFDILDSSIKELTDFIISKAEYNESNSLQRKGVHYLIYLIINDINNKIYVGQHHTSNIEKDTYFGSGTLINKAKKKYGEYNFRRIILFDFEEFEDMDKMEEIIVNDIFVERGLKYHDVYNLLKGGRGQKYNSYNLMTEDEKAERRRILKEKQQDRINSDDFVSPIAGKNAYHKDGKLDILEMMIKYHMVLRKVQQLQNKNSMRNKRYWMR